MGGPNDAITKTTDDIGSSVISGATALADGKIHCGVSVNVSADGRHSSIVIPDCTPSNGVTRVYITDKIELKLERLSAFLVEEEINVPSVLERFLTATSFSCDAFYYTHVAEKLDEGAKEPAISQHKAALDAPKPLLMQFSLNFDNVQKADIDLAVTKVLLDKYPKTACSEEQKVARDAAEAAQTKAGEAQKAVDTAREAARNALTKAKKETDEKKKKEFKAEAKTKIQEALTKTEEAAKKAAEARLQVEKIGKLTDAEVEDLSKGGLIKALTKSDALSELFDIEGVSFRAFRCDKESLPLLQEYAAGLSKRSAKADSK